jgi:hypothetical protein
MLQQQLEETTIKLHTDKNQHVWYAKNIGPPANSGVIADEFLRMSVITGLGNAVRLLGVSSNAELISELYLRRHKGEIRSVEVAGPNMLDRVDDMDDPRAVLMQMRRADSAPACGGWHSVTPQDYPTYAMMARMLRTNFVFDTPTASYLRMHPAYRALTFIPTLQRLDVARLLTIIIDPRWYVDRRMPERAAKLELYLGLTPQIQTRVSAPNCFLKRNREFRCATVLWAWRGEKPERVDLENPANFLYRIYKAAGGGAKGELRASQAFIRYLRHNWLAALDLRHGPHDPLFAPDLFFKFKEEIDAFEAHMQRPSE